MDQRLKAFLVFGTISVIIYVIVLMTSPSEKSFVLTPSGNRDPTKQKLMVVDQDSGEISFVHKSLQGLNQGVTDREVVISDELAQLRSDMITHIQATNERVATLENHMKTILGNNYSGTANGLTTAQANYTKHSGNEGILGKLRKRLEDVDAWHYNNEIRNGERIAIKVVNPLGKNVGDNNAGRDRDHWLNDDGCDNRYGHNDKASWCVDNAADRMYIHIVH